MKTNAYFILSSILTYTGFACLLAVWIVLTLGAFGVLGAAFVPLFLGLLVLGGLFLVIGEKFFEAFLKN